MLDKTNHQHRQFAEQSAKLMVAMANPRRIEILGLLQSREHSVGELAEAIGMSQSALSQHLSKLRKAQLVTTRREAQNIFYSSGSVSVRMLLQTLMEINYQPQANTVRA